MLFLDGNHLIYDERSGASALDLTSEHVAEKCSLVLYPGTRIIVPVYNRPQKAVTKQLNGFFSYNLNKDNPKEVALLKKGLPGVSDETIIKLLEINADVRKEIPIAKDLTHLARGDQAVIDALTDRVVFNGFVPKGENKTIGQRSNEDELFIQIPTDTQINAFFDDYTEAPVPAISDVIKPYPSRLYKLPKIVDIMNASQQERPQLITSIVEGFKRNGIKILPDPSESYVRSYIDIPEEYIFGDSMNTYLPIQPNEQRYYDSLLDFMRHHIHVHNKFLHRDYSEEQLNAQTDSDFNKGIMPTGLRLYLEKLLTDIIKAQYFHTGMFSDVNDINDGDENRDYTDFEEKDSDIENSGVSKIYYRNVDTNIIVNSDADYVLIEYLNTSSEMFGCSVFAEAAVKLMRWGNRKPNMLVVGQDNPNSFDLVNMRIVTSTIDFSKLTPLGEGTRTFQVHGCTTISIQKEGLAHETVAVLIMNQQYINPYDDKEHFVIYAISVPDFIKEFKTGNKLIGIDFVDGWYKVEPEMQSLSRFAMSQTIDYRFIQTTETLDTIVNLGVKGVFSPAYAILNRDAAQAVDFTIGGIADTMRVNLDEPLAPQVLSKPESERAAFLNRYWVESFLKDAVIINSSNLQEILDAYREDVPKTADLKKDIAEFAYSNMFGDEEEGDLPDMKKIVYQGDLKQLKFSAVSLNGINTFAMAKSGGLYVYAAMDEVTVDVTAAPVKPLSHVVFMVILMANLYGDVSDPRVRFATTETLGKIGNAFIASTMNINPKK